MTNSLVGFNSAKKIPLSRRNDDKFLFIPDLIALDQTIERLDDAGTLKEADQELLDNLITQFKEIQRKFNVFLEPVNETDTEFEMNLGDLGGETEIKEKPVQPKPKVRTYMSYSSPLAALSKDIKACNFNIEIQYADITNSAFIRDNKLGNPFVEVKIYHSTEKPQTPEAIKACESVATFTTPVTSENIRPIWESLFNYGFENKEHIQNFYLGIKYAHEKGNEPLFVISESFFSFSSFLDQKLQTKEQDLKQNGRNVGRLVVRFQLVYNEKDCKERLFREARTREERLIRIRDKGRKTGSTSSHSNNYGLSIPGDSKLATSLYESYSAEASFKIV